MADKVILKHQCFIDKQQITFNFPITKCKHHPDTICDIINLNINRPITLACHQCIIKNQLNSQYLVSIQEIFSKCPSQIISNWPPFQDLQIEQQLNSNDIQDNNINDIITKINSHFEQLKVECLQIIEKHKKKVLDKANMIEDQRKQIIQIYNKISEKEEIQNQFFNNINNQNEIEVYLRNLITKKYDQLSQDKQQLKESFDVLIKLKSQIQFNHIEKLSKQILKLLPEFDFLNPFKLVNEYQSINQFQEEEKDQNENESLQEKVNKIINLINNKTNFCNNQFLKNLHDILSSNKRIFSMLDTNQIFLHGKKPIDMEHFSQAELIQLEHVAQYLANHKQQQPFQPPFILPLNYQQPYTQLMQEEYINSIEQMQNLQGIQSINNPFQHFQKFQMEYLSKDQVIQQQLLKNQNNSDLQSNDQINQFQQFNNKMQQFHVFNDQENQNPIQQNQFIALKNQVSFLDDQNNKANQLQSFNDQENQNPSQTFQRIQFVNFNDKTSFAQPCDNQQSQLQSLKNSQNLNSSFQDKNSQNAHFKFSPPQNFRLLNHQMNQHHPYQNQNPPQKNLNNNDSYIQPQLQQKQFICNQIQQFSDLNNQQNQTIPDQYQIYHKLQTLPYQFQINQTPQQDRNETYFPPHLKKSIPNEDSSSQNFVFSEQNIPNFTSNNNIPQSYSPTQDNQPINPFGFNRESFDCFVNENNVFQFPQCKIRSNNNSKINEN